MEKPSLPPFESRLSPFELIAVLLWLPVHLLLLPLLFSRVGTKLSDAELNLLVYAVGAAYMLLAAHRFLRRDFDPLLDRPGWVLLEVGVCYGAMLLMNLAVGGLLSLFLGEQAQNPNNEAVVDLALRDYGKISAAVIFLAPIVEECIFRGAIFGALRRFHRIGAMAVSVLAFALYHVWGYAIADPVFWLYALQYVPAGYLLCRCYERCDSIWASIFFHMLVNAGSLRALVMLQEMLS